MTAWRFSTLDAFRAVLSALPAALVASPVRAARIAGGVVVETDYDLGPLGAEQVAAPVTGAPRSCWAEVLPLLLAPDDAPAAMALFVVEDRGTTSAEEAALALAGEMLRLGCDQQDLLLVPSRSLAVLRVAGPPYYTLLRARDGGNVRAFVPSGGAWVEAGFACPPATSLRTTPGQLLLLPAAGPWTALPDGPWTPLGRQVDFHFTGPTPEPAAAPTRRMTVPLRLGRAPSRPPGLWISDDPDAIDALLRELPEAITSQLEFAVLHSPGRERVLLRTRRAARAGQAPPELPGTAFAAAESVPGLFLPVGTTIEPPVRSARLRALLHPPEGSVAWVDPAPGPVHVHFVAADRFAPLEDWVDYLLDRDAVVLEAWVQGVQFQFDTLRVTEDATPAPAAPERKPRERRERPEPVAPAPATPAPAPAAPRTARPTAIRVDLAPGAAAKAVEAAERAFLALDAPGDAPERGGMWHELAVLYGAAGRSRDAGLSWGRAAWADPAVTTAFAAAMSANGPATALLGLAEPSRDQVRAVAALTLAGQAPRVGTREWLERHGHVLDLRTWWLAQVALAGDGADRDVLLLARARDRVFGELHQGLPAARELPAFLRFSGVGTAARLAEPLERIRAQFFTAKRTRHALEAPVALTRVYVDLVFAWGFARLGVVDRAADLRAQAIAQLPPGHDAIHRFCAAGLSARITQAIDGEPVGVPLPPAIAAQLNELPRFDRYKVDRLRQACSILEPQERLDPILGFTTREADARGEVFAALRGMVDPDPLNSALGRILADAAALPEQQAARLYDGVLDFLPALPHGLLGDRLTAVLAAIAPLSTPVRAPLAAEALAVASAARMPALVEVATRLVSESFATLGGANPIVVLHLDGVLRSLRRARRTADAHPLLARLAAGVGPIAPGEDLAARLALAGGLLAIGSPDEAQPAFTAAWQRLGQPSSLTDRMALARGLSRAQAFASPESAVDCAARLFGAIGPVTDSFNTNSHFAISLVEYAECVVQAVAHEELTLGERGLALVEEDEFLLRQRVHRDLAGG